MSQNFNQEQLYAEPPVGTLNENIYSTLNNSFKHVDDFVARTNSEKFSSLGNLAIFLTKQFNDEQSKVRSIYTWIALNLLYDKNAILSDKKRSQQAEDVWKSKEAVCEGYANLFHEMCSKAGIESRIVKGYVNSIDELNMRFPNHAWNSVKIDGKWKLLDVTWASVSEYVNNSKSGYFSNNYIQQKIDNYFLVNPTRMILTHLPEDPYWQLQNNYVSMEIYQKGAEHIKTRLQNLGSESNNFEKLIAHYESLDSLDRSISFLERMEQNKQNKVKEYGLGIAYFYKAQRILKNSNNYTVNEKQKTIQLAKSYYKKSLDQLTKLRENDFGYEFSKDLGKNVAFRLEVLR